MGEVPLYFTAHTYIVRAPSSFNVQDVALFNEGQPAVAPLKLMAEEGDNSGLLVRKPFF